MLLHLLCNISLSPQCLSYFSSQFDPEFFALIGAVCEREAPRFSPVGVAATLYGMARVGFYSPGPLRALAGRAKAVAGSMTAQVGSISTHMTPCYVMSGVAPT